MVGKRSNRMGSASDSSGCWSWFVWPAAISTSEYGAARAVTKHGLCDLTELIEHGLQIAHGKRRIKRFYLP